MEGTNFHEGDRVVLVNVKETETSLIYTIRDQEGDPVELWLDKVTVQKSPTSYFKKFFEVLAGKR
jgi:tRNA(Met) C34 N-acetyltransferase TmcA